MLVICPVIGGCFGSGLIDRVPGVSSPVDYLPNTGAVTGLVRTTKKSVYRGAKMGKRLGGNAALYVNYGARAMATADYTLGGADGNLTVEIFIMEQDVAGSGLFHHFRGHKLRNTGRTVTVGAEGVVDTQRKDRNLYFYKESLFCKLIYTGREPVPNLVPLGQRIAGRLRGHQKQPRAFQYLALEGIKPETASVSPGYTFNCQFLPPGVFADAPGAGAIARAFLIEHDSPKSAAKTAQDYRAYLSVHGANYGLKYGPKRRRTWWARQPDQGRVICTQYREWLVGVQWPKNYTKGEALIERIVDRIKPQR